MKNRIPADAHKNDALAGLIASLPDESAPADFTQKVMAQIVPKRVGFWRRLGTHLNALLALFAPHPLPAAAALAVLLCLPFAYKAFWSSSARNQANPRTKTVNFVLDYPTAERVAVIGSFNHWQPNHFFMHRNQSDGHWHLTIELQPGRHAYAFIVDDKQILPDPHALWEQEDGFGARNSILTIEDGDSDESHI